MPMPARQRILEAYSVAVDGLLGEQEDAGHWIGELATSSLSTATAISALSAVREQQRLRDAESMTEAESFDGLIDGGISWLEGQQNHDGGWGDTSLSHSNISTTMLVLAAMKLAGRDSGDADLDRAQEYIEAKGGIDGLRERYGKDKTFAVPILSNCAIAGQVSWREVSPLPFEAAWVPQKMYRMMRMPVVSYAIPALVAIGQARFHHRPTRNPLARLVRIIARKPTLRVLEKMQPASGGYLEAIPLTSFVVMGLASIGQIDHPVVRNGIRFIRDSVRPDGSWPIDTNLATWNTTLSVLALGCGLSTVKRDRKKPAGAAAESHSNDIQERIRDALHRPGLGTWIGECQHLERHAFTGADPGGWGWSDLSGAVPDADDTPGALLALAELRRIGVLSDTVPPSRLSESVNAGLLWLLNLQNRDGGWPTFCRGWGKLPFDRSGSDLTAHALRAFTVWLDDEMVAETTKRRMTHATARGLRFLERQQHSDGSWIPLWFGNQDHPAEENPVYGTAKVLMALRDLGRLETPMALRGLTWVAQNQNPDGGWGGGSSVHYGESAGKLTESCFRHRQNSATSETDAICSTVEETALAIEAVLNGDAEVVSKARLEGGLEWLVRAVESGHHLQSWPIGFYFAKLWYYERLYPRIFTVATLGRVIGRFAIEDGDPDQPNGVSRGQASPKAT